MLCSRNLRISRYFTGSGRAAINLRRWLTLGNISFLQPFTLFPAAPARAICLETEMNVLKNMEAWLVLLFGVIIACAYLHDATPAPAAVPPTVGAPAAPMPVVIITAKRPSAEHKRTGN
jgi:hypothetical protein